MRERVPLIFALVLAVILPLAGLLLAGARLADHRKAEAGQVLAATVVGAVIWSLLLSRA